MKEGIYVLLHSQSAECKAIAPEQSAAGSGEEER